MAPRFGTSGLRGRIVDLTPDLVSDYVRAFLAVNDVGTGLWIGHDLRPSSPELANVVAHAAQLCGIPVIWAGPVPTPALALAAAGHDMGAIMVTGSHIPADRNGLKFYTRGGQELTKAAEPEILAALGQGDTPGAALAPRTIGDALGPYALRYQNAFAGALTGLHVGLYAHSAVGRDVTASILQSCGARVTELGRDNTFIPIDTEALSQDLCQRLIVWADTHPFDAIVSTDADGDRPLLADATGQVVPGDILGQITAQALRAKRIVTPVSANSGVDVLFRDVTRTRIGSPFVIAGMHEAGGQVIGYEPNGGVLLGFDAMGPTGVAPALMTRDAMLPLMTGLWQAQQRGGVSACVAEQPARFTARGRLTDTVQNQVACFMSDMDSSSAIFGKFMSEFGLTCSEVDRTDGLRIIAEEGAILHLRPSGNAPEMRFYTEADSPTRAAALLDTGLAVLKRYISSSTR